MNKQKGNNRNPQKAQQSKQNVRKPAAPNVSGQPVRRPSGGENTAQRQTTMHKTGNSVPQRTSQSPQNNAQSRNAAVGAQKTKSKPKKKLFAKKPKKPVTTAKRPAQVNAENRVKQVNQPNPSGQSGQANRQQPKPQPQNKPVTPPKPIDKKTRMAAEKAMNTRHTTHNTRKHKGGNYILYYLMFAVIAVIVFVILSNTVLFKCTEIIVNGASRYTADEITEVSRIRKGNNLLHIDKSEAEGKIAEKLIYVEKAEVSLSFPSKVVIDVVEAERWFCVTQHGVTALISRGGKILEKGSFTGYPVVSGYDPESFETGSRLTSKDETKQSVPVELLEMAEKLGIKNIDSIDLTDRYAISMNVDGRIRLELGSMANIESKFIIAKKLIDNEISPTESVVILLTNPEKVAVQNNVYQKPAETPETSDTSTDSSDSSQPADNGENPENSSNAA